MSDIKTTSGELFSDNDSARMAYLVFRRFGRDDLVATAAWNRLLQNNCSVSQFMRLMARGAALQLAVRGAPLMSEGEGS